MDTVADAYQKSIDLIKKLSTEAGFIATTNDVANYKRIWARDGVVLGLASLNINDPSLLNTFRKTLETLKKHQDETGRIPSNVSIDGTKVSYGTTVGRIDATIWYVIGVCQYYLKTKDRDFLAEFNQSVLQAIFYLKCLELNGRGFIYLPQGGDWADEYINHGYVLYDEILYYLALFSYAKCSDNQKIIEKKDYLGEMLKINFLPKREYIGNEHIYHKALYDRIMKDYKPPLPIAYFSNHSVSFNTDVFATGLFLLTGLVSEQESREIQKKILKLNKPDFSILPSFDPVINEGDHYWSHLRSNFLYEFRNFPYEYHNGGRWPLVNGFFLASLSRNEGLNLLIQFAEILKRDNYIFPEFYNGQSFKSRGTAELGFSAAGFIFAYQAIVDGKKPFNII